MRREEIMLSPEELREKLMLRAANYTAKAEKAPADLRRKIYEWSGGKASVSLTREIIEWLEDEGYIDDERYARAFVSDRVRFSKQGPLKIRYDLGAKGIAPNVVRAVLAEVTAEEWEATLYDFLSTRVAQINARNKYEYMQKLLAKCIAKGFDRGMLKRVLPRLRPLLPFATLTGDEVDE